MAAKKTSQVRRLADSLQAGHILVPTIEKALLRAQDIWPAEYAIKVYNKERTFDSYFHPSSDTLTPELQLFYEFSPDYDLPKDPLTSAQIMTFQVGSAYHSLIQSMLIHLDMLDPAEVEVGFRDERRHCSGTLDIRSMKMPNGQSMPVEIKSAGYGASIPQHFMDKYIAQLNVYMDVGCGEPQEQGLLLILEKQSPHRFREILVKRDEILLSQIYRRWNHVLEAVEFGDPSMLQFPCHEFNSKAHVDCPARMVCPLGRPTVK